MSAVYKFPDQEKQFDEASDWIAKFDQGLSAEQERDFQEWLYSSPQNYEVFMSMAEVWDGMDDLSRLSDLFPEPNTIEGGGRNRHIIQGFAVAASIVLAIVVIGFFPQGGQTELDLAEVYDTSVGESSNVILSDGSRMILNTDSLVRVEYSEIHRVITLEKGEIHIEVAHDKQRPLSIKVGDKVVQAVGTAFNIELLEGNRFELIVTDGMVRVADREVFENRLDKVLTSDNFAVSQKLIRLPEESLSVSKGEKLLPGGRFVTIELITKVEEAEIEQDLSWRSGSLVFTGDTLEDAINEISRYTPVEFEISDEELKSVRVAGRFRAGDVKGLLSALDESFSISSTRVGKDKISLHKGGE